MGVECPRIVCWASPGGGWKPFVAPTEPSTGHRGLDLTVCPLFEWLRRVNPDVPNQPLSRLGQQALRARRYLDADQTHYLHLSDGGVSDNLAMRSAGAMMQALSLADLRERGYLHVRRLLAISVDGQGTQDSSVARRKQVGGLFAVLGLVSGATDRQL